MKPMLAAKDVDKDLSQIRFPVLCSPKLDGIRCIVDGYEILSRSLKQIPNNYIRSILQTAAINGMDGELIVGRPNAEDVYHKTNSGVMSRDGEPDFAYYVFDMHNMDISFDQRLSSVPTLPKARTFQWQHIWITSVEQLLEYEQECLGQGYEGVIIRTPYAKYKFGRSTLREQGMMKLKRFVDAEAQVLDVIELEHNDNVATINELGHTKRSSAQSGKRAADTMGALLVRDCGTNVQFNLGSGFTAQMRKDIWSAQPSMVGRFVKYKYFPIGVKEDTGVPRHPIFQGFRDPIDFDAP